MKSTSHPGSNGVPGSFTPALGVLLLLSGACDLSVLSDPITIPGEIFVMNADGSAESRLTYSSDNDELPFWSPDSSRIGFVRAYWELHVVGPDGSAEEKLVDRAEIPSGYPRWSPDGNSIVFVRDGDIFAASANGKRTRLTENLRTAQCPFWSPDGSRIAFAMRRAIYIMNADGSDRTEITSQGGCPFWSPDGSWIAFERDGAIHLVHPVGSGTLQLTDVGSVVEPYPDLLAWSPDSARIAFLGHDGNYDIYVVGIEAPLPINLTDNGADDSYPTWSPNGTKIAFVSDRDDNAEIYVMDADGSDQVRLTNSPSDDDQPAWSPDGTEIAFSRDVAT